MQWYAAHFPVLSSSRPMLRPSRLPVCQVFTMSIFATPSRPEEACLWDLRNTSRHLCRLWSWQVTRYYVWCLQQASAGSAREWSGSGSGCGPARLNLFRSEGSTDRASRERQACHVFPYAGSIFLPVPWLRPLLSSEQPVRHGGKPALQIAWLIGSEFVL